MTLERRARRRAWAREVTARTPLEAIDNGAGLAMWAAGWRGDRWGVYALAGDGGRLPVWSALEPRDAGEAIAMAGALNLRVAAS